MVAKNARVRGPAEEWFGSGFIFPSPFAPENLVSRTLPSRVIKEIQPEKIHFSALQCSVLCTTIECVQVLTGINI